MNKNQQNVKQNYVFMYSCLFKFGGLPNELFEPDAGGAAVTSKH